MRSSRSDVIPSDEGIPTTAQSATPLPVTASAAHSVGGDGIAPPATVAEGSNGESPPPTEPERSGGAALPATELRGAGSGPHPLELVHVWKHYVLGSRADSFRDAIPMFVRGLFRKAPDASPPSGFWALKDVSLAVRKGETFGIIGANGAGKSTILRILSRITKQTRGEVRRQGRMAGLIEVGAGFHQDLTGRENVLLNASLLGLSRKTTMARFDEIVEFSGVGNFIDEPSRTYSTGMRMRLAFSVAVSVDPEVLLIDEAFAVGDQEFQAKCVDRIEQYRNAGKTLICVSHNPEMLRQFCDQGIWLEHGELKRAGSIAEVIAAYQAVTPGRHVRGIAG